MWCQERHFLIMCQMHGMLFSSNCVERLIVAMESVGKLCCIEDDISFTFLYTNWHVVSFHCKCTHSAHALILFHNLVHSQIQFCMQSGPSSYPTGNIQTLHKCEVPQCTILGFTWTFKGFRNKWTKVNHTCTVTL